MGNKLSLGNNRVVLSSDKIIDVTIQTSKEKIKLSDSDKNKIMKYVKSNIQDMGSATNDYISKFLMIKNVKIQFLDGKLIIKLKIKLKNNKENYKIKNLSQHIMWALNEASFRAEPLKISSGDFTIPDSDINKIFINFKK